MKDAKDNLREDAEPTVRQDAVHLPMWLIGLLGVLTYWGFSYIDVHGGNYNGFVYEPYRSTNQLGDFVPKDEFAIQMRMGARVYDNCVQCHQALGGGNPGQAPPLAGSEWVLTEGPNRIIRIPIVGLTGPIKVGNFAISGSMPNLAPKGGAISDEQLAAVLTYVRNSWGNRAPRVTVEDVQSVRADLKNRTDPYTVEELIKLSDKVPGKAP